MSIESGIALSKMGQNVVLVDFSQKKYDKTNDTFTLADWVEGKAIDLRDCLVEHSSGLKLILGSKNEEEQALLTPEVIKITLSVLNRRFDVVIVENVPK